jgi:hypothetical protein
MPEDAKRDVPFSSSRPGELKGFECGNLPYFAAKSQKGIGRRQSCGFPEDMAE